jgi:hypothetical protein
MPTFARTIVVLDHASGALRVDDDTVVGFDLHPDAACWLEQQTASGLETVLALPATASLSPTGANLVGDGTERLQQFARVIGATRVVALSSDVGSTGDGDAALSGEPGLSGTASGGQAAFVCADRSRRGHARAAGFVPAAHPAMLPLLAEADQVVAARFVGARSVLERFAVTQGVIPMHFQPAQESDVTAWALIGVCAPAALAEAVCRRLWVLPLDCDPGVDDLVWARVDAATEETRADLLRHRVVFAEPGQALIALGPDESSEALHLHGAHGHTELLAPDPGLLQPARAAADLEIAETAFAGASPILEEVVLDPTARRRIETARSKCSTMTRGYSDQLDRYTGVSPLDGAGSIVSRHIAHPDNKRVEAQLLLDLRAMGYCAWRHDFLHNGVTHSNVIADLPGRGTFRIKPATLDRLRRILASTDDDRESLIAELQSLSDTDSVGGTSLRELSEPVLRRELARVVALEPWNPWWKLKCPMAGLGAGLVIVGAHLDSTAGFDPGYSSATDPAPGRDDNGSGLAAVLTLAQNLRHLADKLTHTLRFCFFNAEEVGLVGSKAYASQLKAQRAPVRAVFCMDMIGYNSDSKHIFELHAGYTDPAIRDLSTPLASRVAAAAADNGTLLPAQVYSGTGYSGSPDRTVFDGGINRSDHAAFQQQGWGAVLASGDLFANLPSEPAPDANPNYHRATDQTTDTSFARAITCATGRAATLAAL